MNDDIREMLQQGVAIPAHPLALNAYRNLDERRQRALSRYYIAAGAGGLAVGVHTTQFAIREPKVGLFKPVLELAREEMDRGDRGRDRPLVRIAGVCGRTEQAVAEATLARGLGYHAGLLSLAALKNDNEDALVAHCRAVAEVIPIVGFYLQPAVGGRVLPYSFWRRLAELPRLVAIKMAPFNRYQTLDVVRAAAEFGRDDLALYTGNDDNIVMDLLTPYRFQVGAKTVERRVVGGLLGHWAVWTKKAVELLDRCHSVCRGHPARVSRGRLNRGKPGLRGQDGLAKRGRDARDTRGQDVRVTLGDLLRQAVEVTDCNAAFFDAANGFAGCIAGLHEVLRRQGLLEGTWCLNPAETLGPGQAEEIDRVYKAYPHLNDDEFVLQHRDQWLAG